jgi:hypothetical protein
VNIKEISDAEKRAKLEASLAKPLNTFDGEDAEGCCRPRISAAIRTGELDKAQRWECPKCGQEFTPLVIERDGRVVRHWRANVIIEVLR